MNHVTEAVRTELSLLTADQVAALLQVTRDWLYDEARAGRFPSVRLGPRTVRFRPEDVQAFLTQRAAPRA